MHPRRRPPDNPGPALYTCGRKSLAVHTAGSPKRHRRSHASRCPHEDANSHEPYKPSKLTQLGRVWPRSVETSSTLVGSSTLFFERDPLWSKQGQLRSKSAESLANSIELSPSLVDFSKMWSSKAESWYSTTQVWSKPPKFRQTTPAMCMLWYRCIMDDVDGHGVPHLLRPPREIESRVV